MTQIDTDGHRFLSLYLCLSVKICVPSLLCARRRLSKARCPKSKEEQPDQEFKLFDDRKAYVEITVDEWRAVKDDPAKADALARRLGGLVQKSLGASWHRWHESESELSGE